MGFREELTDLINKHSRENGSNTPDFILAEYLDDCLNAFDKATKSSTEWYTPQNLDRVGRERKLGKTFLPE